MFESPWKAVLFSTLFPEGYDQDMLLVKNILKGEKPLVFYSGWQLGIVKFLEDNTKEMHLYFMLFALYTFHQLQSLKLLAQYVLIASGSPCPLKAQASQGIEVKTKLSSSHYEKENGLLPSKSNLFFFFFLDNTIVVEEGHES